MNLPTHQDAYEHNRFMLFAMLAKGYNRAGCECLLIKKIMMSNIRERQLVECKLN